MDSFRSSMKRARDFISPPPTGWRIVPNHGNEYQGYQRMEWNGEGERPRARSPSPTAEEQEETAAIQRQALELEQQKQGQIDNMIAQLKGVSRMDLENENMLLRYVVASVIKTHGVGKKTINLLINNAIVRRLAGEVKTSACALGSRAAACVKTAAGVLSRGASSAASSAKRRFLKAIRPSEIPVAAVPEQQQIFPPYVPLQALQAFVGQAAPGYASAPPSAPASAPAPAVEEDEEDECSICMDPARDNAVLTTCKHRFHRGCVTPWLNSHRTCPMCRNTNPTPLVPAPAKRQRQGGGGSRKPRSKSKSKSKTRRLRKSRNKSRKPRKSCKSRKPRSSSRRK